MNLSKDWKKFFALDKFQWALFFLTFYTFLYWIGFIEYSFYRDMSMLIVGGDVLKRTVGK